MMVPASVDAITLRGIDMNKAEFIRKWEHIFKLINDEGLFPGNTSKDLPILMLRDALSVIIGKKEARE